MLKLYDYLFKKGLGNNGLVSECLLNWSSIKGKIRPRKLTRAENSVGLQAWQSASKSESGSTARARRRSISTGSRKHSNCLQQLKILANSIITPEPFIINVPKGGEKHANILLAIMGRGHFENA